MPTVSQLPAQLDAECVAGDPFTISVTSSGATITSPTLTIRTGLGVAVAVSPTVSQAGAVTTVAFSAANTAALNPSGQTKAEYLYSLSALVDGQGPFQLIARSLTVYPVGTAGVATSSAASLAVTVGSTAVSLAVTLGGGGGGSGDMLRANNLSDVLSVATARTNLGLGSAALLASSAVAQTANNLSDLASPLTARVNIGAQALFQESNSPTAGVFSQPRLLDSTVTAVAGRLALSFFTADKSFTASSVRAASRTTAASGLTLCRFGLYTVDGSGNGTLVASTPSDTALFIAPFTAYTKALSASINIVAGQRYAAGWLFTGTTMPSMYGAIQNFAFGHTAPRMTGDVVSIADIPASFTESGVNSGLSGTSAQSFLF